MFGNKQKWTALALALACAAPVVAVGCEGASAAQGADVPDGNADLGELGQGDSAPAETTDAAPRWTPPKPPFTCEPDNPKPWEEWVIAKHTVLQDQSAPPPEVDAQCKPIYDKGCKTVCDCKFMNFECGLVGANWQVPWQIVPYTGGNKGEGCWQNGCLGTVWPKVGVNHLQCVQGQCYATGTYAKDKVPAGSK